MKPYRKLELVSELVIGSKYHIMGNLYSYLGIEDGEHTFVNEETLNQMFMSVSDMVKAVSSGIVFEHIETKNDVSVPEYPDLDEFTLNTFVTRTADLWDRCGIIGVFNRSELLAMDDLCRNLELKEIPAAGSARCSQMASHPSWKLLKRYILNFSPDTELP